MSKKLLIVFGLLILLIIILLWVIATIYPEWLWFDNLNFFSVFWTMLLSKIGFGLTVWLGFLLILFGNLYIARRLIPGYGSSMSFVSNGGIPSQVDLSGKTSSAFLIGLTFLLSFIIASRDADQWPMALRFLYQEPFGSTDPIFNRDIGYYVFSLPFYLFIQNRLMLFLILGGVFALGWYLKKGGIKVIGDFTPGYK